MLQYTLENLLCRMRYLSISAEVQHGTKTIRNQLCHMFAGARPSCRKIRKKLNKGRTWQHSQDFPRGSREQLHISWRKVYWKEKYIYKSHNCLCERMNLKKLVKNSSGSYRKLKFKINLKLSTFSLKSKSLNAKKLPYYNLKNIMYWFFIKCKHNLIIKSSYLLYCIYADLKIKLFLNNFFLLEYMKC